MMESLIIIINFGREINLANTIKTIKGLIRDYRQLEVKV